MAEPHDDEIAIKGALNASIPSDSVLLGLSANCGGMRSHPNNSSCPCLVSFTSDFLLFDDPETATGACASPTTSLHSKEPWFTEEVGPLPGSRSTQEGQSSHLRTIPTRPRERKKLYFCRYKDCSRASRDGFPSRSVRDRHQAIHDPKISCAWEGCTRLFSRVDSMKKHLRCMHQNRRTYSAPYPPPAPHPTKYLL
jgi:hypothetical protein